jgi:hypothetical protein
VVRAVSIIRVIIALMMEAACTSETSVDIQLRTRQYIPEDSELHTRRRENLKSHISGLCPNEQGIDPLLSPLFYQPTFTMPHNITVTSQTAMADHSSSCPANRLSDIITILTLESLVVIICSKLS